MGINHVSLVSPKTIKVKKMKILSQTISYTKSLAAVKLLASAFIAISVVGCTGGNPYVTSADRNEIITVGDSIFDLSGELQVFLEQKAGQTFRNYTQNGAKIAGISQQYTDAKADDANIQTIVMDAGGNDILIPAILFDPQKCKTRWYRPNLSSKCKAFIDDVYVDGVNLLNSMDADGVSDVIFLGYYHTTGNQANLVQAVDYGDTKLSQACANSTANCTFVDPRSAIVAADVKSDGIHPTTSGSQKLADLIWPELQPLL